MKQIFSILLAGCLVLATCLNGPVSASSAAQDNDHGADESKIGSQTLSAAALVKKLHRAGIDERQALLDQLSQLLRERRSLMINVVVKDPAAAQRLRMPQRLRDTFPVEVRTEIEQHTALEGTLETIYEEYGDRHVLRHFLINNGRRFSLHFASAPPALLSGTRVRAHGVQFGDPAQHGAETPMIVDSGDSGLEVLAAGGTTVTTTSGAGTAIVSNTFGEKKTAVVLVNFPAKQTQPWTIEQARTLVFGTPNDFIRENSYGQTWLTGDVYGWLTLPVDISTCDAPTISWQARQTLKNAGVDLSAYDKIVYAFPDIGCAWSGLATVGGNPAEAWFDGTLGIPGIVSHEIGHTFGLAHSHALESGSQVLSGSGSSIDYGDVLDVMGNTSAGHFNAFQKQRLGWLDYSASPLVTHVVTSGSYTIAPLAAAGSAAKALQIPQGTDASGRPVSLYLEYRQPTGFDSFLSGSPYAANVLNGVVVHLGTDGDFQSSYLLDMTPASQTSDWNDPCLTLGKSYQDPASGVTITTQSVGSSGAQVAVSFASPQCVPATPVVAITPGQGAWVPAGTTQDYTITVSNSDSPTCSSATFALSSLLPSAWLGSISNSSLTITPGASASSTFSVTSDAAAGDGFYTFTVTSQHDTDPGLKASATAGYVVSSAAANSPPLAVDDTATTSGGAVVIDVLGNDNDPDGDPLSVVAVTQGSKGTVTINANGTLTFTPQPRFKGSSQFTYTISDGIATAGASVTVSAGGGSGGQTGNKGHK